MIMFGRKSCVRKLQDFRFFCAINRLARREGVVVKN